MRHPSKVNGFKHRVLAKRRRRLSISPREMLLKAAAAKAREQRDNESAEWLEARAAEPSSRSGGVTRAWVDELNG